MDTRHPQRHLLWPLLILLALFGQGLRAAEHLPALHIDAHDISVSGISSGGYMAVQFAVAHSASVRGAGIVAAGPYHCAEDSVWQATGPCMRGDTPIDVRRLERYTRRQAAAGTIDPVAHLKGQRVWIFSGSKDETVAPHIGAALEAFYRRFTDAANITRVADIPAAHAMPTFDFGRACDATGEPFINDCDYDGAGTLLSWIYGPLQPKNTGTLNGRFIEFEQDDFTPSPRLHSLSATGWVYVPQVCAAGGYCRLHIAFHGCKQYQEMSYFDGNTPVRFGRTFIDHAGYNAWADSNRLVVLYPQTNTVLSNPNGCWNWWGYSDDSDYDTQRGKQIATVWRMVERLAGQR